MTKKRYIVLGILSLIIVISIALVGICELSSKTSKKETPESNVEEPKTETPVEEVLENNDKDYVIKWSDCNEPGNTYTINFKIDNSITIEKSPGCSYEDCIPPEKTTYDLNFSEENTKSVVKYLKKFIANNDNSDIELYCNYGDKSYLVLEDIATNNEKHLYLDLEDYKYRMLIEIDPDLYYVYYKDDNTFKVIKCKLDLDKEIYYEKVEEYTIDSTNKNYQQIKEIFDKEIESHKNNSIYFPLLTNQQEFIDLIKK